MNETERKALVDELAEAIGIERWSPHGSDTVPNRELATACLPTINLLLAAHDLDALLDDLPDGWKMPYFPYHKSSDGMYRCQIHIPLFLAGMEVTWTHRASYGTGPTRIAAIRDAVAKAKGERR